VAKHYGTYNEQTGYALDFSNVDQAAKDVNLSPETFNYMRDRTKDLGALDVTVESTTDGMVQLAEATKQAIDEKERLNRMKVEGADADALKDQQSEIVEAETRINLIQQNM